MTTTSDKRREVAQRLRDFGLASDYACSDGAPLLGNRRPRASKTHWLLFMKDE